MIRRLTEPTFSVRALALLTSLALVVVQLALPEVSEASHLGSSTASAGSVPPPTVSAVQSFQPDLFTGRATTSIPIAVPPGRKGMQPYLTLVYSSSGRNSWLGQGWVLDVGYIERSTKDGVPKYDSSDTYTFLFQGTTSELVRIADGTYRAKDEGLFLRFESKGISGWEVTDKSGIRYLFGQTVASQVESAGRASRWALDKVLDPNGNTTIYAYAKDQNQPYLNRIDYTGHEPSSLVPTNQITFTLEDRPDVETSYRSGFPITTAKRLKTIETKATVGPTLSLARRYNLAYTISPRTGRSLLANVTQVGTDGTTSLPPLSLTYTKDSPTYLHCHNCVPSISSGNHGWQLQYQVGNIFPRDDGGNDQRLWPSGGWEPGVKTWSEKVCRRRLFWKHCEDEPRSAAIPSVSWSSPQLELSGSSGGIGWSTDTSGNLSVSGPQDSHILAMTWLFTSSAKNISLSSLSTSARADVFYVSPGGSSWSVTSSNQVPLNPGWTVVAVTAYNETGSFSLSMSANLAGQVTAMNHAQFSPMGLAGDFTGDGMTDLAHVEPASNHWHAVPNSGSGFGQEVSWLSTVLPAATVPLVGDVEADGKADLILWNSSSGLWQVARSTGTSFQAPVTWHSGFGAGQIPFMGDLNGDQLLDVGTVWDGTWTVALSTGTSFGSPTTWLTGFGASAAPLTGDFNGDGLTDVAKASSGTLWVALSDGTRLAPQPTAWTTGFGAGGENLTSADLNGDGLTDLVYYDRAAGTVVYAPSTGQGFGAASTLMSDHPFGLRGTDDTLQVGDFRGNGIGGFGVFNALSGAAEIAFAMGTPPDLLETIANGLGGTTTLTYQPSSHFSNTNLHFAIPVVTLADTSDGLNHTYTTRYTYSGGLYDASTKEFRGFKIASVIDAVGTTTLTTFSQDLHTKGRTPSVEMRDSAGRLYAKTTNAWSCTEPYPGVHFTKLDQTDSFIYDGDASLRQSRTRFGYDAYGNLTTTNEDGQVDPPLTGDERTTTTTFTYNTTAWILNRPSLTQTLDAGGTVVTQRRFYYDGATSHTTAPTKGNLTKEEEWLNLPTEQWLATAFIYDAYGNIKTVTDPRSATTTNTYDATGTYLTETKNYLNHTRTLTYDSRSGQITSSIDANGQTTATEYDPLGRVVKVIGPTDTSSLPTLSYSYDLSTVPTKTTVTTRIQSGSTDTLTAYAFADGLGRAIQTRSPAENLTKQVVTGAVEFDARGLVGKQWVPYLDALSTSYISHTTVPGLAPPAVYAYDPLGRLMQTTAPDGSITLIDYNDGETTTTAANTTQTQKTVDAYGRLIQVEEVLSDTEMYTTTYEYDALNSLTKVVDAKGNITRVTYDSLGRKLSQNDPDMGRWTYAYDAMDNLTSQTDARGVVTNFMYDPLNRLTQKSSTTPADSGIANPGTVTYTYDDPLKPFSKGKLTKITDSSGSTSFEHDGLGRLIKESKTIDGTTDTVQRSFDLLGRLTSLTHTDNEVASYTYNAQGGIETIELQKGAAIQTVVSDVAYNAAGQLTKVVYGNGTVTDYTYTPQTLRLDQLKTAGPAGTLQDFSYTFDSIGNVAAITDRVRTGSQSFQYDPLNRLTQAIGSYGTYTYAYDAIGNMTTKEGVTMTYGLVDGSKPHAVTSTSAGWTLQYDANGNLTKKIIDSRPQTADMTAQYLSYDAENRLIGVKTAQEITVTLQLKPGHNFFSLPVIPNDNSIAALFPTFAQDLEWIGHFNAAYNDPYVGHYQFYVGHAKFDDFTTLEYGKGYQVYCKNPNGLTVQITGKLPTTPYSLTLLPEWHLLPAIAVDGPQPVSWLLQGVNYDQIWRWNAQTQQLEQPTQIQPGEAYFVRVVTTSRFTPPTPRDPTSTFVYDGEGNKVKQITAGGTTIFLGELFEKDQAGKTTKSIFAGNLRIATKTSTGELFFYHTDHLGSSNVVTDATGAVVELTEHVPYGLVSRHEGTKNLPHKFTGQRQDTNTGFILFPARAYDPQLGRFIQPDPFVQDPADPQTLNRYSYVRNNPVNFVDPSGHFWQAVLAAIVIIAAVVFVVAVTVSFVASAVSLIASATGHERTAQRAARVAVTAAWVALGASLFMGPEAAGASRVAGLALLVATTAQAVAGDVEVGAPFGVAILRQFSNTGLQMIPGVSQAYGARLAYTGVNPITGEELSPLARVLAATGLARLGFRGPTARHLAQQLSSAPAKSIETPYGPAYQAVSRMAKSLRKRVLMRQRIYRGGKLGKSTAAEGQFWAPENPQSPGYASRYGAGSFTGTPEFVIGGSVKPGADVITRQAPGYGVNTGGALEVVTNPGDVRLDFFHMPDAE